ncbi:MAG: tRNA guanosine(15) transglycosylase TgtA [Nitrososphaerales archaeon]
MSTSPSDTFEIKATDMGARLGILKTKTSEFETPALLPVIHPVRQLLHCSEIRAMGYEAVMTNAYTTLRRLKERASEGIHRIIDYDGSIMTDSGGYQALEFGSVDTSPVEMARFEEKIGSDIAIILDKPTGFDVTKKHAAETVQLTLKAAQATKKVVSRDDVIWTLPVQGGRYIDLIEKSAKASARLDFGCYALGSPVEVMEEYEFSLLIEMIAACKRHVPENRPFHLFGAGHPLILPLAISLGCDMFDSASYMLYAKQDRYISSGGTIRLEQLGYLGCSCKVCTSFRAGELKRLPKEARIVALAKHNLFMLRQIIEETKQAMWEGRLWEYVQANSRNHPKALEAFRSAVALKGEPLIDSGTPSFKDRGLFVSEPVDLRRPEMVRHRKRLKSLDLSSKETLIILPETKTKPCLRSKIYKELAKIVHPEDLVAFACPNFGLVPAEISDIYPISQTTSAYGEFPKCDAILHLKEWKSVKVLLRQNVEMEKWLEEELLTYFGTPQKKLPKFYRSKKMGTVLEISRSYKTFKRRITNQV